MMANVKFMNFDLLLKIIIEKLFNKNTKKKQQHKGGWHLWYVGVRPRRMWRDELDS